MRRGGKPDASQAEIVQALRKAGYPVAVISAVGGGVPDLLTLRHDGKTLVLLEVKVKGGRIRESQERFASVWPVAVVRTAEDALAVMRGR